MGDKQAILSQAVPDLVDRLLHPRCLGADGKPLGSVADDLGNCKSGRPEFPAVYDMHVAILSSSVGSVGGDLCIDEHGNDHGRLLNRNASGTPLPNASPSNFLAWLPPRDKNAGKPDPVVPEITEPSILKRDFSDLITGVGELGCGYEAQLESVYRFLIQPDPYDRLARDPTTQNTKLVDVDNVILRQRKDFLRPDSFVAVVMLTDENESTVDPLGFGGHSYLFTSQQHVKSGTSICATDPNSPQCQSCFLQGPSSDIACHTLTDGDDNNNVRFFHMKERFGVDPRYPIERYVRGFSERLVPDRQGEHPSAATGAPSFNYVGEANCQNPLFAATLPSSSAEDLCHLASGPRTRDLVHFALIGGVPWQLLTEDPHNYRNDNGAAFKAFLDDADWVRLLGQNPFAYDFAGVDPHMLESMDPRAGIGPDDAHLSEWDTQHKDLQYACTFKLPQPRDCSSFANPNACDCQSTPQPPICNGTQTLNYAKAYPSVSQLAVAKGLGLQAFVGSICPRELADTTSDYYGYRPAITGIVNRLSLAFE